MTHHLTLHQLATVVVSVGERHMVSVRWGSACTMVEVPRPVYPELLIALEATAAK